jgi:hypothetical protein
MSDRGAIETNSTPTPEGCWKWNLGDDGRYPRWKRQRAHRIAYVAWKGEVPEGYHVHHVCENPLCVNPDHLEAVDAGEHRRRHRKTHCHKGHPFDVSPSGRRRCLTCARESKRAKRDADPTPRWFGNTIRGKRLKREQQEAKG